MSLADRWEKIAEKLSDFWCPTCGERWIADPEDPKAWKCECGTDAEEV
jgi:predicted RNA-binding Zn-ribbon protein involved in translation (DUF1610 family)